MARRAAAAIVAALVVAGCGDPLDDFRADLRPHEERAEEHLNRIESELHSLRLGDDSDARELRAHTTELDRVHDEIAEVDPPDGYEDPFARYVRANRRMVSGLERLADALVARDVRGMRRASRDFETGLGESQSARLRWLE